MTTYAQLVDKAYAAKGVEEQVWKENALMCEIRRIVPHCVGFSWCGGPGEQKMKGLDSFGPLNDKRTRGAFCNHQRDCDN